jgi:hypothetical protein
MSLCLTSSILVLTLQKVILYLTFMSLFYSFIYQFIHFAETVSVMKWLGVVASSVVDCSGRIK